MRVILATLFLCLSLPSYAQEPEWYQKSIALQGSSAGRVTSTQHGGFIHGRLKCAVNINVELARRGIQGTGSALAKSFLKWGRPSAPVPGAVAVYDRGGRKGHVAIVKDVLPDGRVVVLNPGRRGWQVGVYHKRAIAYRVAS